MTENDYEIEQEADTLLAGQTLQDMQRFAGMLGPLNFKNAQGRKAIFVVSAIKIVHALDAKRISVNNEADYLHVLSLLLAVLEEVTDGNFMSYPSHL